MNCIFFCLSDCCSGFLFCFAGEDPLTDSESDIDSVAGVLKLYFRGLEKPLFPEERFSQLMECVRKMPFICSLCFCVIVCTFSHPKQYLDM